MLNIVIPMAGRGSRFANVGFTTPKPLIDVKGKPMIEWVVKNISPTIEHRILFVCQKSHVEQYQLRDILTALSPNCCVVEIDGYTEGAASSVLCAKKFIDNEQPLMIANADQWVSASIEDYLAAWDKTTHAGHIMTMTSNDPKWSYIRFDKTGGVTDVVEKVVASDQATVGIYNFSSGALFCKYAEQMIDENNRSKGEFYVAPIYKYLIDDGHNISLHNIGQDQDGMYGLGTPEDLNYFVKQA